MKPKRLAGAAGVCARAVPAGTIASSNGKATAAPKPRRNVRRASAVFVMNIANLSVSRNRRQPHLERCASDDAENDGGETIPLRPGRGNYPPHGRHVLVGEAPA